MNTRTGLALSSLPVHLMRTKELSRDFDAILLYFGMSCFCFCQVSIKKKQLNA